MMSQLYKIQFVSVRGALTERGTYLVSATSIIDAEALLATHLPFPPSTAVFTTSRVKPSIYELSRSESVDVREHQPAQPEPDRHAPLLVYSEPPPPPVIHDIAVHARIRARSLNVAVRRMTDAVLERISAGRVTVDDHVEELEITTDLQPLPPREQKGIAGQTHFLNASFVRGGAVSPR